MLDAMRMRTVCFARTPQRYTSRLSKHFLLTFQEVTPPNKTRNRLNTKCQPALTLVRRGWYVRPRHLAQGIEADALGHDDVAAGATTPRSSSMPSSSRLTHSSAVRGALSMTRPCAPRK